LSVPLDTRYRLRRHRRAIPCLGNVTAYAARLRGCSFSRGAKGLAAAGALWKIYCPRCWCCNGSNTAGARERTPHSCWVWGHARDRRGADSGWGVCISAALMRRCPACGHPSLLTARATHALGRGRGLVPDWTRAFAHALPQMARLRGFASPAGFASGGARGVCAGIRRCFTRVLT